MSKRTGSKACTVREADIALLNATLDQIRDSDPLAALSRCLIDSGVTEEELARALKQRGSEPISKGLPKPKRAKKVTV
jgi:DNA-binding phage protein